MLSVTFTLSQRANWESDGPLSIRNFDFSSNNNPTTANVQTNAWTLAWSTVWSDTPPPSAHSRNFPSQCNPFHSVRCGSTGCGLPCMILTGFYDTASDGSVWAWPTGFLHNSRNQPLSPASRITLNASHPDYIFFFLIGRRLWSD